MSEEGMDDNEKKPTMPFDLWLKRLYDIMRPDLGGKEPETYADPDGWRDYWEDGDTPEETWQMEKDSR